MRGEWVDPSSGSVVFSEDLEALADRLDERYG